MEQPSTESELRRGSETRLYFIDNLRVFLVALVVVHHVAMTYGAAGLFYYVEFHPTGFSRELLVFVLTNQAWFMGTFFLVAGYFTPRSFDRKGAGGFMKERLLRLGLPVIVYALLLNPLAWMGGFFLPDYLESLTWESFEYWDTVRMGPMWFVVLLLVFSAGSAGWRVLTSSRQRNEVAASRPSYWAIGVFTLGLAGTSYLMRSLVSVGEEFWGFPSLAYLPEYLGFFAVGAVAYRRDWFRTVPLSMGLAGLGAAAAAMIFLFPLAFSGEMFSLELSESLGDAMGNGQWRSAAYALWDSILVVGLSLFLVTFFRAFINKQGAFGRYLARSGYTVYIIHIPIVVFVAVALRGVEMNYLLKVGLAAAISIPLCWVLAYPILKIPGVAKIL